MHLMNEVGDSLMAHLDKLSSLSHTVDARESLAKYGTDIISSCAFGIRANCFEQEDAEFREASRKIFQFDWKTGVRQTSHFFVPSLAKALGLPFFPRDTMAFLKEAFWSTMKEREASKTKRNDLIDIMIQIKNEETVYDEVKFGKNIFLLGTRANYCRYKGLHNPKRNKTPIFYCYLEWLLTVLG